MDFRLLLISERFPPDVGGVARSADRLSRSLGQLGLTVDVLTWSRYLQPGAVTHSQLNDRLTLHQIGLYRNWDMTLPHSLNVIDWLHQTHPYTMLWGHYLFPAGFLAAWWGKLNELPSIVSARGNDVDRALFPPGDFARLQWTLSHATQIAAVSQDIARKIALLSDRSDVFVLPNVVDSQIFAPIDAPQTELREALGIDPDEMVLGFCGELREKKGQPFLTKALTTVQSFRPACLLIIGELRPSAQEMLNQFAADHPEAAKRVIVTGYLSEPQCIAQHLSLCDVYLQPSLWEGMPNALLEAMSCARCCIASDAGGIAEVIQPGETGFLLSRTHLHRLGEAVLECLELGAERRRAIGKAARQYVQTHHSPAQEQKHLQALLTQTIDSRPSRLL